jgi:hypothetical protein
MTDNAKPAFAGKCEVPCSARDRFALDPESGFVYDRENEEWLTEPGDVFDAMWPKTDVEELARLRTDNAELRWLLARYRDETPLGNQPHMIAHQADEALGRGPNATPHLSSDRSERR